jgi:hypothetical protein
MLLVSGLILQSRDCIIPVQNRKNREHSEMAKRKRKLTSAEKAEKRRRRREYMTIFINGKQKRVKRPPTIEGLPVDEFIRRNADPIWLFQNEMHEELYQWEQQQNQHEKQGDSQPSSGCGFRKVNCSVDDLPF